MALYRRVVGRTGERLESDQLSVVLRGLAPLLLGLVLVAPAFAHATPDDAQLRARLAGVHLPFIENQGQVDARVAYYTQTFAGTVFITQRGQLVYALPARTSRASRDGRGEPLTPPSPGWSLTETFRGGKVRPAAERRSPSGVSYLLGNDPSRWHPDVPSFGHVSLGEVWPGITVTLKARGQSVEKVFTVDPRASVERIRVRVSGARALSVGSDGALVAATGVGNVTFTAPVAYQERDGVRREVAVAYRQRGSEYGFSVGHYDKGVPLVIDPLLRSTYLGGSRADFVGALAIHPTTGDVYVAGSTRSSDFPGTGGGAQPSSSGGPEDAFVARLDSGLTTLIQATYLGGSGRDEGSGLAIHPTSGDVYVVGTTDSGNFPGTAGGAQPTSGGGADDGFIARLNSALTVLVQATYLGGSGFDVSSDLAIHPTTGDVYVAGSTSSSNFPGTAGGAQSASGGGADDAYIARLNSALTVLVQATYLGGSAVDAATGLAIHPTAGDVYVTGRTSSSNFPGAEGGAQPTIASDEDAFVARLNSALTTLVQATYLGGSAVDAATDLAIHPMTGDVYVTGLTDSGNFPGTQGGAQTTSGTEAAFVARLNSTLTTLLQATYLGGSGTALGGAVAIHPTTGNVYLAGTAGTNLPGTAGSVQPTSGGNGDAFVARLNSALTQLIQATYLGGSKLDGASALAIHTATGDVYVAGTTGSSDFPRTGSGAQPVFRDGCTEPVSPPVAFLACDGFIARIPAALTPTAAFTDVPPDHPFFAFIEALAEAGITAGCATNPPQYCPDAPVTRGEMAVFLVRGIHGAGFLPPPATGAVFVDVPAMQSFASWIEQLFSDGITAGCATSPPQYCPDAGVTRGQMAVFLLRSEHGTGFLPPPATGTVFVDVPATHPFAAWIEQLFAEGITGGCATTPAQYCPDTTVTRGQMAVFLVRTFGLPM